MTTPAQGHTLLALVITEAYQQKAADVLAYASRPDHWYDSRSPKGMASDPAPYTFDLGGVRCFFTHTVCMDGTLCRHLSVQARVGLPDLDVAHALAYLLGFTGPATKWHHGEVPDPVPHLVIVQVIGPTTTGSSS